MASTNMVVLFLGPGQLCSFLVFVLLRSYFLLRTFLALLPTVVNTQGEKGVDSRAERGMCLFRLQRRQDSWSQAGNGHTQGCKQAGEG